MLKSGLQRLMDINSILIKMVQVRAKFVIGTDVMVYFEPGSGNLAILRYVQNSKNQWLF